MGYDFDKILESVADLFEMETGKILQSSKWPQRAQARSLVCYRAVRQLSIDITTVGEKLGLTQSSISKAVRRVENRLRIKIVPWRLRESNNFMDVPPFSKKIKERDQKRNLLDLTTTSYDICNYTQSYNKLRIRFRQNTLQRLDCLRC